MSMTTTTIISSSASASTACTSSLNLLGSEPAPAPVPANAPQPSAPPQTQPPQQQKQYVPRLLYRGAFSVPDSHLLLDGLTFTINLPADDPQASLKLLENPLPLALESMRGRPSLSYVGVERMDDLYCDFSGGVTLHVHPRCILTYQLFAHNLCMDPITHPSGRTDLGIRVRLGDSTSNPYSPYPTDNTEVTDIVIYGRPHPCTSIMQLCVARIMPMPPPVPKPIARLRPTKPRPDDPTPRCPSVGFGGMARIGLGMGRKRNISTVKKDDAESGERERSNEKEGSARKKVKRSESGATTSTAAKGTSAKPVFKVPPLPPAKRDKDRDRDRERERARKERARQAQAQAQAQAYTQHSPPAAVNSNDDPFLPTHEVDSEECVSELEKANKVIVKKTVVHQMSTIGISKQHPDFKDFFGHVYRGVSFALRAKLKSSQLEKDHDLVQRMERLVQSHVDMYIEERDSGVDC